jgi:hypothetical protein
MEKQPTVYQFLHDINERQNERLPTVYQFLHDLFEKRRNYDQTVYEIMCGKPLGPETFPILWDGTIEEERRANIDTFVQIYKREPSETEIITGEINDD